MLDAAPLTWSAPQPLPVERLILGRDVAEAAALLPRVFNLCRGAQEVAARLAFGLPLAENAVEALHAEILRDHVMALCVRLPRHLGQVVTLPEGWRDDPQRLRALLPACLPARCGSLDGLLAHGGAFSTLLSGLRERFLPDEAACDLWPIPQGRAVLQRHAQENSVAGRWADHPLMQEVELTHGRGPLWRVLARVIELEALLSGALLPLRVTAEGEAIVPAARGAYAVQAETRDGTVTRFDRVTPTDHLLAPGGVLDQSLARLPAQKAGLAPLLLDVLDPCVPVHLTPIAETRHA